MSTSANCGQARLRREFDMPSFQWTLRLLPSAILTALALTAAPQDARANNPTAPWERVGMYEGRTLYIDPTTARKSGSRIQIFAITDLRESNATARGRTYWSKKALLEFDCNQRTLKILQDTWYPRKMAQGEPVFQTDGAPDTVLPVQADSQADILWKAACGRR
jgi:hypothetical protein